MATKHLVSLTTIAPFYSNANGAGMHDLSVRIITCSLPNRTPGQPYRKLHGFNSKLASARPSSLTLKLK